MHTESHRVWLRRRAARSTVNAHWRLGDLFVLYPSLASCSRNSNAIQCQIERDLTGVVVACSACLSVRVVVPRGFFCIVVA